MTAVIVAGLGVGLALLGIRSGLRPRPRPASAVLRALDAAGAGQSARGTASARGGPSAALVDETHRDPARRLASAAASRVASVLEDRAAVPNAITAAVRATGRPLEALVAESLLAAVVGLALPPAVVVAVGAAGLRVSVAFPIWGSVVFGVAGAALPLLVVRGEAGRVRHEARTVVAAYLDLVVLCLAGGMGIESALQGAAAIADDPVSARIAAVLGRAQDAGEAPWVALSELGSELGVTELEELAAAVRLAGTEGARIRTTLAAKAVSIRRRELADAEAEANTVTDRLFLPGAVLLVGFLLFLGFPAVARITTGL